MLREWATVQESHDGGAKDRVEALMVLLLDNKSWEGLLEAQAEGWEQEVLDEIL